MAQVLSKLGVPFEKIRSRTIRQARVRRRHRRAAHRDDERRRGGAGGGSGHPEGKELAAEDLEAAPQRHRIPGRAVRGRWNGPQGRAARAGRRNRQAGRHARDGGHSAFPTAATCEVEIDPETGQVDVVRYSSVNDFTVINPLMVEGPDPRRRAAGLRPALPWRTRSSTRPASSSPARSWTTPSRTSPTFRRRCPGRATGAGDQPARREGRGGRAGSMTSVMNAVVDALRDVGSITSTCRRARRVWKAIQESRGRPG